MHFINNVYMITKFIYTFDHRTSSCSQRRGDIQMSESSASFRVDHILEKYLTLTEIEYVRQIYTGAWIAICEYMCTCVCQTLLASKIDSRKSNADWPERME